MGKKKVSRVRNMYRGMTSYMRDAAYLGQGRLTAKNRAWMAAMQTFGYSPSTPLKEMSEQQVDKVDRLASHYMEFYDNHKNFVDEIAF